MSSEPGKERLDPRRASAPRARPNTPSTPVPKPAVASPKPTPASSKPSPTPPASPTARPARPQSPAHPAAGPRLEGVMYESESDAIQSIETIVPSGLSTSTYLPAARRNPELERQLRLRRQYRFRQTVIPSSLVLCVSTLVMGLGWFLLDPSSALRDNPLGLSIPITLIVTSAIFGVLTLLLATQAARLNMTLEPRDPLTPPGTN